MLKHVGHQFSEEKKSNRSSRYLSILCATQNLPFYDDSTCKIIELKVNYVTHKK